MVQRPLVTSIAVACLLLPASASAAPTLVDTVGDFGLTLTWQRSMPGFMLDADEFEFSRVAGKRTPPLRVASTFLGFSTGYALVFSNRWVLPIMSAGLGFAIGEHDRVLTSIDGTLVEARPWTAGRLEMHALGFGFRERFRRFMFAASLKPGVSALFANMSVIGPTETTDGSGNALSFSLRAEVELCRRHDPVTRTCLAVAPLLYDFGWLGGGTATLRLEFGP